MGKKIYIKIILFFSSLCLSLLLLEFTLYIAGMFFINSRPANFSPYYEESSDYVRDTSYEKFKTSNTDTAKQILCIGDSFTNAGNVKSYHSYPYQLYEKINSSILSTKKFEVLNMGLCEDSTFGVEKRLKDYIEGEKNHLKIPNKIIILIGAADKFERYEINKKTDRGFSWMEVSPPPFYKKLRIYKMYRHIKFSFLQKKLEGRVSWSEANYERTLQDYLRITKVYEKNNHFDVEQELKSLPPNFINYCSGLHINFHTPEDLLHSLVIYISKLLSSKGRHPEAIPYLLDLAKRFPKKFWGDSFQDGYFRLVQIYQIQSRYDSQYLMPILLQMLKENHLLNKSIYFQEFKELVSNGSKIEQYINKKRFEAWDRIISLTKKYNIELYIMNYPSNYKKVNQFIKKIGIKYKINIINNHHYFKELLTKYKRSELIEDDDHLTPRGYQLMARFIYKHLSEKK